ncbi:AAA domain-containing protein [Variovorax dokdonensis]|uniref:AAA domain-containing protein n=1 Tax=Variovorax dokdonensis TaxID=344883 RepID=A0ABT7N575_9BURK|nr:AAA domain-containing protein [Variovorax dokdonensis]MDM0043073.1 AAA domain-containing protein [Variovorax dokdonensis]
MAQSHAQLLFDLLSFVRDEQQAANEKLLAIWNQSLPEKLGKGMSQSFTRLERADEPNTLWAYLGDGESRFREGDLLLLHAGDPLTTSLGRGLSLDAEEDDRWLLRGNRAAAVLAEYGGGCCYGDPDGMDLTPYYERALEDISTSRIGRDIVLPLLGGDLDISFDDRDVGEGELIALTEGFNQKQAEAVGLALGAEQIACIQGPPGTGKTRVLSLIARLLVLRGERVLMTSHTHMAINNALNKIHEQGVPTVKVGRDSQRKGLDEAVACYPSMDAWEGRPTNGYVVGATPFATCTARLENYEFDTVIFDEASQITVALALMAMRKGKRFIFIGDQKQLPPVVLSRSVLAENAPSVFGVLTSKDADHTTMLAETYRMNHWLTDWPSRAYYGGKLVSAGTNRDRRLVVNYVPARLANVFEPSESSIFIPTLDITAKTRNFRDAELVVELCAAAVGGGVPIHEIGVVTPYRSQGRAVRNLLRSHFGGDLGRQIVADTVERMQGQEREFVILSLATGDEAFLGAVAPFFFQPERLNVSITRPKSKLIVIGPQVSRELGLVDKNVLPWIAQYCDLISRCFKVDLSA